ncbi:hypothetical protein BBF96_14680 [Anoxybacter fermentans]|uniref:LysM domain-containing protein n=1 Tax=Anoxybacter fermentans TaxID=1323375 RepID=A0A3S9T1T9_9FIRM|nr:SPOCS domain-containing protein [Anoxybacter fermentans]AZR74521.1 hypothetical protein BBF96_14680 [Anoxybacter fermentans]
MAIKFKEERIKAEVVIAREVVKDVVSGDIELRAHENDSQISEVLDVKAQVKDVKAIIVDGGVEINGVLNIDCLYNVEEVDEDHEESYLSIYQQNARIEFENFIDIPEAKSGMNIFLNIRVADITYEVLETDMLEVAVTLIKYCAVSDIRDIKCITGISGLPKEEIVEEQLRLEEWIGDETIRATVAKEVDFNYDFHEMDEVLAIVGEIVKTEYKTMENAVTCEGVIEVSILYRSNDDEEKLHYLDERIEFNHTLDLYGVEPGMIVYGNYKLTELSVQKMANDKIRIVGQVECYAKVTRPRRLTVVTDILNDMFDTERVTVLIEEMIGQNRVRDSIVHRINVPPTRPDVKGVLQCYSRIKDLTSMVNDGGVVVEGSIEGTAYYTAEEDYCNGEVTVCLKDYFDFDNYISIEDCEEGMDVYVEVEVKRTSCQVLNDRTLEMNVLLEKCVKVTSMVEIECVTDLVEISPIVEEPCPPSYIVYVVQKGDTLWKIARRYKVNLESLIEFNNIENPDKLEVGQKICIPKALIGAKG